jgi:hypothetical protein
MENVRVIDGCLIYQWDSWWNKGVDVVGNDGSLLESMVLGDGELRYLANIVLNRNNQNTR